MKVVKLEIPNLMNVTANLRRLADMMENGEVSKANSVVVIGIDEKGELEIYGYGEIENRLSTIGLLHLAMLRLS